jgi:hypothetical protein
MGCLRPISDRSGYENSIGETLCNPCYLTMWSKSEKRKLPQLGWPSVGPVANDRRSVA